MSDAGTCAGGLQGEPCAFVPMAKAGPETNAQIVAPPRLDGRLRWWRGSQVLEVLISS